MVTKGDDDVAALLKFVSRPSPGPERRVVDTVIERPETDDIVRSL